MISIRKTYAVKEMTYQFIYLCIVTTSLLLFREEILEQLPLGTLILSFTIACKLHGYVTPSKANAASPVAIKILCV